MTVVRVAGITIDNQAIRQYYYETSAFKSFRLKQVQSGADPNQYQTRVFVIDINDNEIGEIQVQNSKNHPISYQPGETYEGRDVDIFKDIQLDKISKHNGRIYRINELHCKPEKYEHPNEPNKVFASFKVTFQRNPHPDLSEYRNAGLLKKLFKASEISIRYVMEIVAIIFSILTNIRFANPSPPASSSQNTWSFE